MMVLLFGYGATESASYYFLLEFVLYIIGRKGRKQNEVDIKPREETSKNDFN